MSAIGYIQARAYASRAQIPLEDVAITIFDNQGRLLAMRLTDSSGKTDPVTLEVPDLSAGQSPNTGQIPYLCVNLIAWLENYEQIEVTDIQVFPGITTTQELEMVPLSELPDPWDETEFIDTPSQNL